MEDTRLPAEYIKDYLTDPGNGLLIWAKDTGCRGKKGRLAGSLHIVRFEQRWQVQIEGRKYLRSHLVFALYTGRWPHKGFVLDHINKDTLNDCVTNLREVTQAVNMETRFYPKGHAWA